MLPSAEELTYFLEVCSVLNFSRASKKLGIAQPSLSLAMKRLEETLGTAIFIRHKSGVSLTPAGRQFSLHAKVLLDYWTDARARILASDEKVQGSFTLGCHTTIAIYMASRFMPQLLAIYPQLEIHFKNDISRKITERVIHFDLDLGLVVNPLKHPELVMKKLCDDQVSFWVAKKPSQTQDIHSPQSVLICDPQLAQTQILLSKIKSAHILAERIITTEDLSVVASLTAAGAGIGILPERVAKALYPNKLQRLTNLPYHADEIYLIYRGENRSVKAIQTIVKTITDTVLK